MKRYFVLCAFAAILGSTAKAQDACHPFYIGTSSGVSLLQDLRDDNELLESDAGFAFSAFLGWNEGPGRLEFEYSRFNNDIDTFTNSSLAGSDGGHGNVDLDAYMTNGYLDFPISSRLTAYLGGGLGVAQMQLNSLPVSGMSYPDSGKSNVGIAYQAKVGASYSLTSRAEWFAGYRFLGTEKLTASRIHEGDFGDQFYMHSLETGLRFKF